MTTAVSGDLCRITVVGPEKKVDLAVPTSTTVAALMPVLLWHTTGTAGSTDLYRPDGAWCIQRLGGAPFDPNGTPQSLDWLEGEELHLRPTEDPLPELDFDDLADGIATVVGRRTDRWRPEYRRHLFLLLSAVALLVLAAVAVDGGTPALQGGLVGGVAGLTLVAAALVARILHDRTFALLFSLAGCGFTGLLVANAADGAPTGLSWGPGLLSAGAAMAGTAFVVAAAHRFWERALPYAPMLVVGMTGVVVVSVIWLRTGAGLTATGAAGLTLAVLFTAVVLAPKPALRFARLRGPQLPKTSAELQFDHEPEPAEDVDRRANEADTYLSVTMVGVGLALPFLMWRLLDEPGWVGWTIVLVVSGALLLRARTMLGVWQRIPLALTGTAGMVMVITWASGVLSSGWRGVLLAGLVCLVPILVLAALRPWPRRLLPVWEFTATVLDVVLGMAVIPLVLQLLGAYAWARGLFG